MTTGGPILGSPSLVARLAVRTEPCAPVSIRKGNGPLPSMQTLAIPATCDCRVLTVTGRRVPPPASRFAPVQPWPAGGSANCTMPAILDLLPAVPPSLLLAPVLLPTPWPPAAWLPGLLLPPLLPAAQPASAVAARTAQHAASRLAASRQCKIIGSPSGQFIVNEVSG